MFRLDYDRIMRVGKMSGLKDKFVLPLSESHTLWGGTGNSGRFEGYVLPHIGIFFFHLDLEKEDQLSCGD